MINKYQDLDRLDQGSFKAFLAAAKTLNFTVAARQAAMTQSGVSQHVARLERQLGVRLFARINRRVDVTEAGRILAKFIERQLEETDALLDQIQGIASRIKGKVRYAMPHSCLFAPHFAMLLDHKDTLEEIDLEVSLCPNDEVLKKLLNQEIDFGFVTRKENNPAIHFEWFCREEYILAGSHRMTLGPVTLENLLASKFIAYPGGDVLFDIWARHHFRGGAISFDRLRVAGSINSLHGAVIMLDRGAGVSVLPRHCVERQLAQKRVREFAGRNKAPLLNDVSIVTLKSADISRRVRAVLDVFLEMRAGGAKV